MKKLLVVLLLLSLAAGMVFADDAKVMPKGVIRAYFLGTYGMTDSGYDEDGEEQDSVTGESSFFNQGFAAELGVTDQITAALQWTPGMNLTSSVENDPVDASLKSNPLTGYTNPYGADNENLVLTGPSDLFAGAKIQILGDKGFVKNDQFRFSMAPGFRIPLDSYDADDELANYKAGDDWRASAMSNEALGFGSRFYFDYLVNEDFFINLYSELIYNFPVEKKGGISEAIFEELAATPNEKLEYKYGTDMIFEIEPQYKYDVSDKSNIYFGLPLNYAVSPDVEVDGTSVDDSGSQYLQLRPEIGYFCADFKVPFEASIFYGMPLYGVNATKMQTITLKVIIYARLFD